MRGCGCAGHRRTRRENTNALATLAGLVVLGLIVRRLIRLTVMRLLRLGHLMALAMTGLGRGRLRLRNSGLFRLRQTHAMRRRGLHLSCEDKGDGKGKAEADQPLEHASEIGAGGQPVNPQRPRHERPS